MISAGASHSMVVLEDQTVWGFGSNRSGQLGAGSAVEDTNVAVKIDGFDGVEVQQLCCGQFFGVALALPLTVSCLTRRV